MVWLTPLKNSEGALDLSQDVVENGVSVEINTRELIQAVYVAPGSLPWYRELVESVTQGYYADIPVHQSGLDHDSLY